MKDKTAKSRIDELIAEMCAITEFANGSIISSSSYYTTKDGVRHKTKPQFKFQTRGARGKQKLMHIPGKLLPKVRSLIANGRRLEALQAEYSRLMTETSLDTLKKKRQAKAGTAKATARQCH